MQYVGKILGIKKTVIERDSDLLSSEEMSKRSADITEADLEELKTWLKYKCFERCPRTDTRNIIDC